ncbi:MAG: cupin domain-containing protein [Candidatus Riflebacteria bacterium]|nr:cupin domain-containing protein [Candidatus Riflebacteria bacterium]
MNVILLSGGSGKRLWPLSNDIRSKQFIKIFKHGDQYESMIQRVYRQIADIEPDAAITIATSQTQVPILKNQLGEDINISIEPCRRDTFPAIVLATAYLNEIQGIPEDEALVVCPVDPYVEKDYFIAVNKLWRLAQDGAANLVLMGMEPTYPSEKYGYIIPEGKANLSKVSAFKEKPDAKTAQEYIDNGGLWNGGVFAYKISYVLDKARELLGFSDYADLLSRYDSLAKISFDYAVVEQEPDIAVLRFAGQWKDLGTWNTFAEAMEEASIGDVRFDDSCDNVHAINELGVPILAMGLKDTVISASPEGILVSDKNRSSFIKPYVDNISHQVMFAEKTWGSFRVLDIEENSMTVKVTLKPGHRMNYHSHEYRDEVWTVISGRGKTIVDGMEQEIAPGDVVTMAAGCKHTVIAETEIQLIEVQIGKQISVNDKKKHELYE